jgi:hypothetical protein
VEGVGADQVDVIFGDAGGRELLQDRLDGDAAHGAERGYRGVVEGDEDGIAGLHHLAYPRKA